MNAPLDSDPTVVDGLVRLLNDQWHCVCDLFRDHKTSRKSVHEIRRQVRRFLAVLDILNWFDSDLNCPDLRKQLKREFKEVGRLRDLQVLERKLKRSQIVAFGSNSRLTKQIHCCVKVGKSDVKAHFKKLKMNNWEKDVTKLRKRLLDRAGNQRYGAPAECLAPIVALLKKEKKELLDLADSLRTAGTARGMADAESFHQLRKRLKSYNDKRDLLKRFLPIEPAYDEELLRLQKKLGEIQDTVILEKEACQVLGRKKLRKRKADRALETTIKNGQQQALQIVRQFH